MKIFRMSNAKLLTKITEPDVPFTIKEVHAKALELNPDILHHSIVSIVKSRTRYVYNAGRGLYVIPNEKMELLKKSVERELPTIYKAESMARSAMSEVLAPNMTFTNNELMEMLGELMIAPGKNSTDRELSIAIGDYLTRPSIGVYHIDNTGFLKLKLGIGYKDITGIEHIDLKFIRSILPERFTCESILLSLRKNEVSVYDAEHLKLTLNHLVEIGELTRNAGVYSKERSVAKGVVNMNSLDKLLFCN